MEHENRAGRVDHTHNIIEVDGVTFGYGAEPFLDDVTLMIHEGDYIGLIGPNGGGKTTLLKLILGLLRPQKGEIRLFGKKVDEFRDWKRVGYVAQRNREAVGDFPVTAEDVVGMARGRRFHFLDTEDKMSIRKALEYVGMWECRSRLMGELSGGQQQRVFIARALVNDPDVIFLDEPTTGVDADTQEEFYRLLRKLNREKGITLVLVSHDIVRVTREVMHIACVDRGITSHSSPQEYLEQSESADIFGENVRIITHHHHKHD
jgi:zinc transport system ATP-binding protein